MLQEKRIRIKTSHFIWKNGMSKVFYPPYFPNLIPSDIGVLSTMNDVNITCWIVLIFVWTALIFVWIILIFAWIMLIFVWIILIFAWTVLIFVYNTNLLKIWFSLAFKKEFQYLLIIILVTVNSDDWYD